MSIVVGIDPSLTSTGVAILNDGRPVHTSHHGYKGTEGMDWNAREDRWIYVNNQVQQQIPPETDLVVIEDIPATGIIMPSLRDRHALWATLRAQLRKTRKIPVVVVNPSTLKTWVTGAGRADKAHMFTTVRSWWPDWPITNDDEADALGLAAIGAYHLGDPTPFEVKERHTTGLAKVDWPELVTA